MREGGWKTPRNQTGPVGGTSSGEAIANQKPWERNQKGHPSMGAENEPGNADQVRRVARIRAEIAACREYVATLEQAGMPTALVAPYRARIAMLGEQERLVMEGKRQC